LECLRFSFFLENDFETRLRVLSFYCILKCRAIFSFCFPGFLSQTSFKFDVESHFKTSTTSPTYVMSELQFNWNWPKIECTVEHVVDQTRFNCAYSGQDPDEAYERDIAYLNANHLFAKMCVTKRHLHGKDGLYVRLFGVALALSSQQCQKGRTAALEQLTPKSLGVSAATMIRDGPGHYLATRERVYDQLLIIANNQMETTSDPDRMTRYERANYDKAGQCLVLIQGPLSKRQLIRHLFFTQPTKSVGKGKKRRLYAKSWTTSEKK
jgi:hypothetical protein